MSAFHRLLTTLPAVEPLTPEEMTSWEFTLWLARK